ncbi:MAG: hypothetical protein ACSLEN_08205 [Candidatus Malihini olakiniferum]
MIDIQDDNMLAMSERRFLVTQYYKVLLVGPEWIGENQRYCQC